MAKVYFYGVKWFVGKASYNCKMEVYIDSSDSVRTARWFAEQAVKALPFVKSVFDIGSVYSWDTMLDSKVLFSILCNVDSFPARCEFFRKSLDGTSWVSELIGKGYIVVDLDTFKAEHVELLGDVEDLQQMPH